MVMVSEAVTLHGGPCWSVNIEVLPCRVHLLMHAPEASISFQTAPRGFKHLAASLPESFDVPEFASCDESRASNAASWDRLSEVASSGELSDVASRDGLSDVASCNGLSEAASSERLAESPPSDRACGPSRLSSADPAFGACEAPPRALSPPNPSVRAWGQAP